MTLDVAELVASRSYRSIARLLLDWENARGALDTALLSSDPEAAIDASAELEIEYDLSPGNGCSVFGYYRYRANPPSAIVIHPTLTAGRDTFTLLHEVGHHIQRQHREWATTLFRVPPSLGAKLEERVADSIAAELLFPDEFGPDHLNPSLLAEFYESSRASRSAIAMRAVEIAGDTPAVAAVVDHEGRVIFARSTSDDVFAPARGLIQPALGTLVARSMQEARAVEAELSEGLLATSGWAQSDLVASVALDHTQEYAFVVIRPAQRFGRTPSWHILEQECSNEACEHVFVVDATIRRCNRCSEHICPACGRCACEPRLGETCPNCFTALSFAEQAGQVEHECI
ncbi:ImmA/IrrE family metallo-endopeptidase [Agromyces italicus]|uniref:ImmA/IrrE family metallo-endopeptidase n=1 Tax=Agromyces italicus TaxID=279572 RepID=UPI0003B5DA21|nr:ImmA/IrrE family metallo-endopeptidase [Agromyces italicus]